MFAKIDVNGDDAAPLTFLKKAKPGLLARRRSSGTHEVPGRPRRQRGRALCTEHRARGDRRRHREAALSRATRAPMARRARASLLACGPGAGVAAGLDRRCASASRSPRPASTGRATDLYSNQVNRAIFDPLYAYAYSRGRTRSSPTPRPDARDLGRRQDLDDPGPVGIFFADDPAFKGGSAS